MDIHFQVDGEVVHSNAMDNKHNLENIGKYWRILATILWTPLSSRWGCCPQLCHGQQTENGEYWRISENVLHNFMDTIIRLLEVLFTALP